MMVREFAATKLAEAIGNRAPVLGEPPVVIDAPPSEVAAYPAVAVHIERTTFQPSDPGPVLQDADGNVLLGGSATTDTGEIPDGSTIMVGNGVWMSHVGTLRCDGRIWIGARYPGKREEIEEQVWFAFLQDDSSPGRLLLDMTGYQVSGMTISFGQAAAFLKSSTWVGEYTFEARLWSWMMFDIDIALFVPRTDAIASRIVLEFSRRPDLAVVVPSDVPKLPDLEKYLITADDGFPPRTTL